MNFGPQITWWVKKIYIRISAVWLRIARRHYYYCIYVFTKSPLQLGITKVATSIHWTCTRKTICISEFVCKLDDGITFTAYYGRYEGTYKKRLFMLEWWKKFGYLLLKKLPIAESATKVLKPMQESWIENVKN